MYVFCGGMYRSCSTWQYEIAGHLVESRGLGRRLGYLTGLEFAELDDEVRRGGVGEWLVLKSHEEDPRIGAALASQRGRGLYAYRDLRDVVFSMMHKRGVTFDAFIEQGMVHQILANDRFWRTRSPVLSQRYDDLVARPAEGVREIAGFLGIELEEGEAEALAEAYSREANLERTRRLRAELEAAGLDLNDPANATRWDGHSLLHWNHVREESRSWRELTGPRERSILGRLCGAWLVSRGFEPDDSWWSDSGEGLGWRDELALGRGVWTNMLRRTSLQYPRGVSWLKRRLGRAEFGGFAGSSR